MELKKIFSSYYIKAERKFRAADHMLLITYPAFKDKKILLKALENLYISLINLITLLLKYEFVHKRIQLSGNIKNNLKIFFSKCSKFYSLSHNDTENLKNIIIKFRKYAQSTLDFAGQDKAIIIGEDGKITEIKLRELIDFSKSIRILLDKTVSRIKNI